MITKRNLKNNSYYTTQGKCHYGNKPDDNNVTADFRMCFYGFRVNTVV